MSDFCGLGPPSSPDESNVFVLTGMDLEPGRKGGTWLGLSKTGRFAVLLNILEELKPNMKGRGMFQAGRLLQNLRLNS